jgi:hypothetical protein
LSLKGKKTIYHEVTGGVGGESELRNLPDVVYFEVQTKINSFDRIHFNTFELCIYNRDYGRGDPLR